MHKEDDETTGARCCIPLFSVGRSQELMLVLESYMANNQQYKLDVPDIP